MGYAVFFFLISTLAFAFLFIRTYLQYKSIYNRFKDVISIDQEKSRVNGELEELNKRLKGQYKHFANVDDELKKEYKKKRELYEKLLYELSIVDEEMEFISYGIYKPHFDIDTSEQFKETIKAVRKKQKDMLRNKTATYYDQEWVVGGSRVEGKKMTDRHRKLILRAFNAECDAAIAKVKWNNVDKMIARIRKSSVDINKMSEVQKMYITNEYVNLRIAELTLTHGYHEKKHQEEEEQKRIREQIREEERAAKEFERAKNKAEKEEKKFQQALEKARSELAGTEGKKLTKLQQKIRELESKLSEAESIRERAVSMAQLTKSGHVYVISNIGSFGDNVYKIGMTRRLDPHDRVRELGDASVPFKYDVHAMVYSDNAPELEKALHSIFDERRLNLVNLRREFFNVSLEEIEKVVHERHGSIEITKVAEAREYYESEAIRRDRLNKTSPKNDEVRNKVAQLFPEAL